MPHRIVLLALVLAAGQILLTCAPGQTKRRELKPTGEARARACILSVETEYKEALVDCLARSLAADNVAVRVQGAGLHEGCHPEQVDLVIVLAHLRGFQPDAGSLSYMRRYGDRPTVLYGATGMSGGTGLPRGKRTADVDAITRASDLGAVARDCEIFLTRARAILPKRPAAPITPAPEAKASPASAPAAATTPAATPATNESAAATDQAAPPAKGTAVTEERPAAADAEAPAGDDLEPEPEAAPPADSGADEAPATDSVTELHPSPARWDHRR